MAQVQKQSFPLVCLESSASGMFYFFGKFDPTAVLMSTQARTPTDA